MRKLFIIILLSILTFPIFDVSVYGCVSYDCNSIEWGYSGEEFDHYPISSEQITNGGTIFDPTGQNISPELIDRLTNEVNNCLLNAFSNKLLSNNIINASYCDDEAIQIPIDKTSFTVKIPDDWVLNCDGTQQVLPTPVQAGGEGCINKGLTPDKYCPCRWRAGISCPNILITTPSFYLYKDILIRFVTGCANPWASPELAVCASPSTTPLSDGSDPENGL